MRWDENAFLYPQDIWASTFHQRILQKRSFSNLCRGGIDGTARGRRSRHTSANKCSLEVLQNSDIGMGARLVVTPVTEEEVRGQSFQHWLIFSVLWFLHVKNPQGGTHNLLLSAYSHSTIRTTSRSPFKSRIPQQISFVWVVRRFQSPLIWVFLHIYVILMRVLTRLITLPQEPWWYPNSEEDGIGFRLLRVEKEVARHFIYSDRHYTFPQLLVHIHLFWLLLFVKSFPCVTPGTFCDDNTSSICSTMLSNTCSWLDNLFLNLLSEQTFIWLLCLPTRCAFQKRKWENWFE